MDVDEQRLAAIRAYRPIADLIPPGWTEGDLDAGGTRLHYYRTGRSDEGKRPLVLLHGIMMSGLTWLRVAKALATSYGYDVILLDARGHGRSERATAGFTYPLLVADAASAICALGLERPAILGHSLGGATAALLAATYPDLPRAVILEDAAWGETSHMPDVGASPGYRAWLDSYIAYLERLRTQSHEARLAAALAQLPPGPIALWPEDEYVPWVDAQVQLDLDLVRGGASLWSTIGLEPPLAELAPRIACPTLLISGSPTATVSAGVVAASPNVRHVHVEGAGHLVHVDQFERFIDAVTAFLGTV